MITITLQQIKDAGLYEDGWRKVLKANGGTNAELNKPFPLVSILDSNGLDDTLWVISNVKSLVKYDETWRKFTTWCALQNIEKIAKYCSKKDYDLIVEWLKTNDENLRDSAFWSARSAARSATIESATIESAAARSATIESAAARSAAWSVVESAARSAADSAFWSARSAVWSAVWSAAQSAQSAQSAQENKLRELIGE